MKTNVKTVKFNGATTARTEELFQYDVGQKFHFLEDFADGTEVQFADGSVVLILDGYANIPNKILLAPGQKTALIQVIGADNETTIKTIFFGVIQRPKKNDYIEQKDKDTFREDLQKILETTKEVAQEAKDVADSVRQDADNGAFDGIDYDHSEEFANLHEEMENYQKHVNEDKKTIDESVEKAKTSADNAKASADRAEQIAVKNGYFYFDIDENGHLIETRTDNVSEELTFKLKEGRLLATYE